MKITKVTVTLLALLVVFASACSASDEDADGVEIDGQDDALTAQHHNACGPRR